MATFEELMKRLQESPDQLDTLRRQFAGEDQQVPSSVSVPEVDSNEELLKKVGILKNPQPVGGIFDFATATLRKTPPLVEQDALKRDPLVPVKPEQPIIVPPMAAAPAAPAPKQPPSGTEMIPASPGVSQEQPFTGLDFGENKLANQQALVDAQNRQNDLQFLANMNRAGAQVAQGIAQTGKLDTSVADAVEKQGKQQVDNYLQQVEFQKQDPNSSYSKGLKDYFKNKLKMEIHGDASAAELEKIMPLAVREYEASLERERLKQQKAEDLAYKKEKDREERQLRREIFGAKSASAGEKAKSKTDDKTNADFMKMAEKLSAAKASSRSAFGKSALNKAAAERLETLVAGRDLNDLDNREIQEVARSLDSLLAQGQPTISGTHELVPKTLWGKVAGIEEYILNQRKGANAASFLKQMLKTVGREKELAQKQMNQYKQELIPGYEHLEERDPERFNRIVGMAGETAASEPITAAPPLESSKKKIVKQGYNAETNQTQLIYSDGSKEIVDGRR